MKIVLINILSIFFVISAIAQEKVEVKGVILDTETDTPILGANIIQEDDQTNGVTTNEDGEFTIEVPSDAAIEVSFVGYAPQKVEIEELSFKEASDMRIELAPESSDLDEVVVVGYGKQSEVTMTGAVSTVKPDKLRGASTNISSNLAGNLSGIVGFQRSGEPGADGANFFIRGISTYSGVQDPLILKDGVEISSGELNRLAPEVIESVSVLKDATATAVYGSRGANGVLIIETKTGKDLESPNINARVQTSVSTPTKIPKFVDGTDYMELYNQAVAGRNSGDDLYARDKIEGTAENRNKYIYPNVDWYNELFKKVSLEEEASVNVQGGGKKVNYFLSATFNNQGGQMKSFDINSFDNNINVQNFNFQNNIDAELSKTTKVALKMSTNLRYYDGPAEATQTIYNHVMNTNPVDFPLYFPADSINRGRNINYGGKSGGKVNNAFQNPFAELTKGYKDNFQSVVSATLNGEQKLDFITKGLTFKATVSFKNFSQTETVRSRGYNQYEISNYEALDNGEYEYDIERIGEARNVSLGTSTSNGGDRKLEIRPSIEYNRLFDKHEIGGLLLYNQEERSVNDPGDLISSLPHRRMGVTGRMTYNFDKRYLFEANFAYNGSENFAKNRRFGLFPSVSAGYVISAEDYFKNLNINSVLDYLKLKASWGKVGNDQIGGSRFPYLSNIDLNGRSYSTGREEDKSRSGPSYDQFENPGITWETEEKLNLGLEMNLFESLRFNLDLYKNVRKDIFDDISNTIPDIYGTSGSSSFANIGEVSNKGFDLSIDYNKQFNKDFQIELKGTYTYAHNTIKKNNEPAFTKYPNRSQIGHPIGTLFGYEAERLFRDEDEIEASPEQKLGGETVAPGDIKYIDITDDGQIDENDQSAMGHPTTPEVIYGLSASLYYKKWDFSFLLQGAERTSFMMSGFHPFGTTSIRNVLQWIGDDYYDIENPDVYASYPRLSKKDNDNNNVNSSYWLRDGSFLKLRSAELGFTYNQFRVFASGYNLLTFSKFKHWDPEEGGGSGLKYPTQRIINIGIQMNF